LEYKLTSHCKPAVDLKKDYGDRYKIALDPAGQDEYNGKRDPWMYIIPCKYGNIYPYSAKGDKPELLGFWCTGSGKRQQIKEQFPHFKVHSWSDDGEAIFLFPRSDLDALAELAKPRRKRVVSAEERERLAAIGKKSLSKFRNQTVRRHLELQEKTT